MKLSQVIPPVLSLLIAFVWLTNLRRSNEVVMQENTAMRERLSSPRKSSFSRENRTDARLNPVGSVVRPRREEKAPDNVDNPSGDWVATSRDWKRLVLSNNDESSYYFRNTAAWKRLVTLAAEMNGDELTSAYIEMSSLPVHAPFRKGLEWLMLRELETKNPELAFSQYIAIYQIEDRVEVPVGAFDEWLARDPSAATTWYESQLSAGVFDKSLDGKSRTIVPLESAFIMSLLASDPTAAEQRMNDIPPELRASMGKYMWKVPEESGKAFIDLLRKTMPMEEYMAILRNNSLTEDNFSPSIDPEKVQRNFDDLGVTREERSVLLANQFVDFAQYRAMRVSNGGDPRREEFDGNRKWIQAVDPSSADRATGIALQAFIKGANTPESYDFVEKTANDYLGSGAGDDLLVPLIEGSANGSSTYPKDKARALAAKISDAALRNELLQKLN